MTGPGADPARRLDRALDVVRLAAEVAADAGARYDDLEVAVRRALTRTGDRESADLLAARRAVRYSRSERPSGLLTTADTVSVPHDAVCRDALCPHTEPPPRLPVAGIGVPAVRACPYHGPACPPDVLTDGPRDQSTWHGLSGSLQPYTCSICEHLTHDDAPVTGCKAVLHDGTFCGCLYTGQSSTPFRRCSDCPVSCTTDCYLARGDAVCSVDPVCGQPWADHGDAAGGAPYKCPTPTCAACGHHLGIHDGEPHGCRWALDGTIEGRRCGCLASSTAWPDPAPAAAPAPPATPPSREQPDAPASAPSEHAGPPAPAAAAAAPSTPPSPGRTPAPGPATNYGPAALAAVRRTRPTSAPPTSDATPATAPNSATPADAPPAEPQPASPTPTSSSTTGSGSTSEPGCPNSCPASGWHRADCSTLRIGVSRRYPRCPLEATTVGGFLILRLLESTTES